MTTSRWVIPGLGGAVAAAWVTAASIAQATAPTANCAARAEHDYPTVARMEYVDACVSRSAAGIAALYQCSCAIDRIAKDLTFEEYVESQTFARNAALGGERAGVFRDSDDARAKAKRFQTVDAAARKACGLKPQAN